MVVHSIAQHWSRPWASSSPRETAHDCLKQTNKQTSTPILRLATNAEQAHESAWQACHGACARTCVHVRCGTLDFEIAPHALLVGPGDLSPEPTYVPMNTRSLLTLTPRITAKGKWGWVYVLPPATSTSQAGPSVPVLLLAPALVSMSWWKSCNGPSVLMSATPPVTKPATTTVAAIRATVHRTTDVSVRHMAARTHVCVGREWREQAGLIKSRRAAQVSCGPVDVQPRNFP
jgi:hypothetical protein